jgi:hypothetical protein
LPPTRRAGAKDPALLVWDGSLVFGHGCRPHNPAPPVFADADHPCEFIDPPTQDGHGKKPEVLVSVLLVE